MPTNVDVPNLGKSATEAVLIRWIKEDGEFVGKDEPVAELETDKANADLPAPAAGVLRHVKAAGDTVLVGETIGRVDDAPAGAAASAKAASPTGRSGTGCDQGACSCSDRIRAGRGPRRRRDQAAERPGAAPRRGGELQAGGPAAVRPPAGRRE